MSLAATILIPTHDHADTLRASVASALRQTVSDIEVFVMGDGVPDVTREIMREFMAADLDGNLIRVFYDFRGDV